MPVSGSQMKGADALAEDFNEASELLYKAARVKTRLVTSGDGSEELAAEAREKGLVYWVCSISTMAEEGEETPGADTITEAIESSEGDISIFARCGEGIEEILPELISYLRDGNYSIKLPNETNLPE